MKIDNKKLSLGLIGLYLIGMIITAFMLFSLKDRLIYDLHIISITDGARAEGAFYQAYVI